MTTGFTQFAIADLALRDFRCFREFAIAFNGASRTISIGATEKKAVGPLTVLVARNGMGKTSVLDAIRILFGTFVGAFSQNAGASERVKSAVRAESSDIRQYRNADGVLAQAPKLSISGKAWLGNKVKEVSRELSNLEDSRTQFRNVSVIADYARHLAAERKSHASSLLPLIAFYGTGRLWTPSRKTERSLLAMGGYAFGYENCLGRDHNFKAVRDWLTKAISKRNIDRADNLRKNPLIESQIEAISRSLDSVLGSEGYLPALTIESLTGELAVKQRTDYRDSPSLTGEVTVRQRTEHGDIPIAISRLSDGVRAVFGLFADIAFRCAKLNPQMEELAPHMTPGLVMIDEIDLHLHPAWQQCILNALQLAFPALQFIVTTHSPQVVSSVPKECIRIVDPSCSEALWLSSQTQGVESQDILADVFGTAAAPENDEWVIKLEEYAAKVAQGLAADGDPLLGELFGHYGRNYQPLLRIELQRRLAKRKAAENA